MLEFIKEKSYYLLGGTVILLVIIIVIASCSNNSGGSSYSKIEEKMKLAAKNYYDARKNKLPKEDGGVVKVNIGTLVDAELLEEIKDPKNKENTCTGYVEVTKVGEDYSYMPFLTCMDYKTITLREKIINSGKDKYGNGIYKIDNEFVYRGEVPNNYISFNDNLWRILKVDSEGDVAIVLNEPTSIKYTWDYKYNSDTIKDKVNGSGNTNDYFKSNIHMKLEEYYDKEISEESKKYIMSKDLCIGKVGLEETSTIESECNVVSKEDKVGLLKLTDYVRASLDSGCLNYDSSECVNYNYLAFGNNIDTWLMTTLKENSYEVFTLRGGVSKEVASNSNYINPVIYLNKSSLISSGNGTEEKPYTLR